MRFAGCNTDKTNSKKNCKLHNTHLHEEHPHRLDLAYLLSKPGALSIPEYEYMGVNKIDGKPVRKLWVARWRLPEHHIDDEVKEARIPLLFLDFSVEHSASLSDTRSCL